jgi:hypothetical protein
MISKCLLTPLTSASERPICDTSLTISEQIWEYTIKLSFTLVALIIFIVLMSIFAKGAHMKELEQVQKDLEVTRAEAARARLTLSEVAEIQLGAAAGTAFGTVVCQIS